MDRKETVYADTERGGGDLRDWEVRGNENTPD